MTIELRPYQRDLVDRAEAAFAEGARSAILLGPTGSGKTTIASEPICRAAARGRRVLFLAHRDTLLEDTHDRLERAGVWSSILQAGRPAQPLAPVQVASLQTLHARGERPPADLVIVDEAHRALARSVRAVLDAYPSVPLIGLTATPERADGQPMGDVFERLIVGPSVAWLTEQGFLVPCDVIAPGTPLDGALAMDPVAAWFEYARSSRSIVFARSVHHAEDIAARFNAAGVPAECITGETTRAVRKGLRERLTGGFSRVLVSVAVFLEGFDAPSIETVILARPFGPCSSFLQAIGRGLRPSPETGKTRCLVLDLTGAVHIHGLPDDERRWSLEGEAVRRTGEALQPIRRCRECGALFRPAAHCPRCNAESRTAMVLPRVLTRAERLELVSALPKTERDRRYLAKLEWVARTRMHLSPDAARSWAQRQFAKRRHRDAEAA